MNAILPIAPDSSIDIASFRAAFRRLAGGVAVITAGPPGARTGFTATSVSSFSDTPPTLVFSVSVASSSFPLIERQRCVGINILTSGQQDVAERFTGRGGIKGEDRYDGARWSTALTGAPLLEDAAAALDARVEEIIVRHAHALVLARIEAIRLNDDIDALLYWRGGYRRLAEDGAGENGLRSY